MFKLLLRHKLLLAMVPVLVHQMKFLPSNVKSYSLSRVKSQAFTFYAASDSFCIAALAWLVGRGAMSSVFSEQIELKGLDGYNSKQVRDKQIARIIRKITTIAAAIYLRMAGRPPVLPSNQLSYTENFLYMLDSLLLMKHLDLGELQFG
ncbi:uncharacterized protein LOC130980069 isoform X3 [Arachis stenosperma]|uniref:uncharacterized protein LOC130980069 isoform X3 n=1 Tax=Arachis stenosperma TaxID=217475 RepID=UPI0025AC2CD0|nr:uncharacterized protein LOC130980069 isoform X3 [Arachis stenosperma]XP_057759673.1 uncharacterized protein LOC130980069 isoform X3 [Arachis stenosperma]XP_057759674.1 uncharacterized protein LOC130980069 isoform X3 [Arachis stenosperma]